MTILFGLTYVFGGMAGKEIILEKKSILLTSIKYSIIIILAIIIYAAIIGLFKVGNLSANNFRRLLTTYFITPLIKIGSVTMIPMLAIWLWATNQMKIISGKRKE